MDIQEQIRGIRNLFLREVNEEKRIITYAGITETVASDRGILRVDGAIWDRFDKNPAFLWSHYGDTIGRVVARRLDKKAKEWLIDVEYASPEVSEFADSKYRLAKAGFLPAVSVGFNVIEFERDLSDDERTKLGIGPYGWVGKKYEVNEFSLVSVGADPEATERAIRSGAIRESDLEMESSQITQTGFAQSFVPVNWTPIDATTGSIEFTRFDSGTRDLVEALQANTEQHQRTQVAQETLTDEIAGLTEFLSRGEKVAEIEVGDKKPDTSDADDDASEVIKMATELAERVANMGDRNEQRDIRST